MKSLVRVFVFVIFSFCASLVLPGCLISSRSESTVEGKAVTLQDVAAFVPGKSSKGEVLARLGEPTRTEKSPEGLDRLAYDFKCHKSSDLRLFLVFRSSSEETIDQTYNFDFEGELLKKVLIQELE